jgi:DNA-directed RNA polymerase subunit RPC12/RpoP
MTGEIPDEFVPDQRECIGGTYHYFRSLDYEEIDAGDAIDCPDCGSAMVWAKKLQTEPMDTGAKFTAYRCPDCAATDWIPESDDVDPIDEKRGIVNAIFMPPRSEFDSAGGS